MEISQNAGIPAYLIDNASEIQREWVEGKEYIGLTAGASAPEILVEEVIQRLRRWGASEPIEVTGKRERVVFSLPRELEEGEGIPDQVVQIVDSAG